MVKKRKKDLKLLALLIVILIVYNLVIFQFVLPEKINQETSHLSENQISQEENIEESGSATQQIDKLPHDTNANKGEEENEDLSTNNPDPEQNTDLQPNTPETLGPIPPNDDPDAPEAEPVEGRKLEFKTGIGIG